MNNKNVKNCIASFFAIIIVLSVSVTCFAQELPRVVDNASLLSEQQQESLADKIAQIAQEHSFDVVIVTTNTFDGKTEVEYADDYYDYNGYGIGENRDGLLLAVNMTDRRWYISTRGFGITAFTDWGINDIGEDLAAYLSDEEYYEGFSNFLDNVDTFLVQAETGSPYDSGNRQKTTADFLMPIIIACAIALVITAVVMFILRGQLKSAVKQNSARNYIVPGSVNIKRSNDFFLYSHVSRIKREENNGSGGSSTHTSSSGASHGGGGGSF